MKQIIKRLLAFFFLPLFCFVVTGQQNMTSGLSNPYLGQKPPGMTPELFAPDIIATGYYERDLTISPDGKYLFFSARTTSERMKETSLKKTLGSIKEYLNNPQNGNYDIYWVLTGVIEALSPK